MLCKDPYMAGSIPLGCGRCLPCRINRRRQWMWRQYLESLCHDFNCFVTLTYDGASIAGNWSLEPRELQLFIKRLRDRVKPRTFRFFAVGEYGEKSCRPHYHLSLFGVSGFTAIGDRSFSEVVGDCWRKGFVSVGEFNHATAQYVAGYTVKKLTDREEGREWIVPEFARMSNRPGIGASAMATISKQLLGNYQRWQSGDVPSFLTVGQRKVPLNRYLIKCLRQAVGFSPQYIKEVKDRFSYEQSIKMQSLLLGMESDPTVKKAWLSSIEGRLIQVEEAHRRRVKREAL